MNEHLRQALREEDTVLFIGSGVSCWAGLPSWRGLLHRLADYLEHAGRDAELVRKEANQDLLQAASYGFDQLTRAEIGDFMRDVCRLSAAVPHDIHRKIVTLGPRCFITTNYDRLIEESLRLWHPQRRFQVVTNRQPFETADIIQTRSVDFVFKPHGDIGDLESIILTREQYRKLLDGGEWKHSLEALKTLLATRRVVYLGFGLRDPDFLLIRDALANTWKGGTRDHYAIMADIGEGENSYWRKNYGIHLVSYKTSESSSRRDHSGLNYLIDALSERDGADVPALQAAEDSSREALLLARHANGLMRFEAVTPEFPLRVRSTHGPAYRRTHYYIGDDYDGNPVDKFLEEGPHRAILFGLPGSGKTYRLRRAAARFASKLHDHCLSDSFSPEQAMVPVFVDLKLYSGDLIKLLEESLPTGLSLVKLIERCRVKVFLDSFNEMPRERWDSGAYRADFIGFLQSFPKAAIIIGSRTEDGLRELDLAAYGLDEIEREFVQIELEKSGLNISGRFRQEIVWLLQRPFYFNMVVSRRIQLPAQPHPKDLYGSFFIDLSSAFAERFGCLLDLQRSLGEAAYEAINRGEEAQPVKNFLLSLRSEMQAAGVTGVTADEVIGWLVSKDILLPYSGTRVSFFHQSVTEFLAATELVRRYRDSPRFLKSKLALRRWDQAMFLAISLMPPDEAPTLLAAILDADFALALGAVKYLEVGREDMVAKLLAEVPMRVEGRFDRSIHSALEFHVPIAVAHEAQLRSVLACGDLVGGAAAARLLELRGSSVRDELLQTMLSKRGDYNYCTQVGRALAPLITEDDLDVLVAMAASVEHEASEDMEHSPAFGFVSGLGEMLSRIELSRIADVLLNELGAKTAQPSRVSSEILCDLLDDHHTSEALELAGQLLLRGVDKAATSIYFISEFSHEAQSLRVEEFSVLHLERLIGLLGSSKADVWSLRALKFICKRRSDLAEEIERRSSLSTGAERVALVYATSLQDRDLVFKEFESFEEFSDEELGKGALRSILTQMDLDWTGHEELFVRLLKIRNSSFAWGLCESVEVIGELKIGPIDWWLDWLDDQQDSEIHWWFQDRLSTLFSEHLDSETWENLLAEFNLKNSRYRPMLARTLLIKRRDLSTDQFSSDAISFLLDDLSKSEEIDFFNGHLLGQAATETFVEERLLPLLSDAGEPLRNHLLQVLQQAGIRHGRRYLET